MARARKYTDMTIEVQSSDDTTRTFGAHRAVLCQTPYFAAMIDAEQKNPAWDGVYRIKMMDPSVFAFLLEYIYTGADFVCPFVCPMHALVVLKAAARVGILESGEMGTLAERCASAILHGATTRDLDLEPLAFGDLPLHAVYAVVTQAVRRLSADSAYSPDSADSQRVIGRVWEAIRARFGGISLCDLQDSLQTCSLRREHADAHQAMLLGPFSKTFTFDRNRASAEHDITFEATMEGQRVSVIVHNTKNCADEYACVDIEVRLVPPPKVAVDQLLSSPRLIVLRTGTDSTGNTGVSVPHGHHGPHCFADNGIPVDDMEVEEPEGPEESEESEEPEEPECERHCMFTVELDPLFDFATAVAVFTLQHDTEEIVKRFEISALCWVLRSPKTVYDPIRVLRALESREVLVFHPQPESDRAAIVAALAPRLAAVPVDLLLDLLRQEPHLSRIDEFTKLVWSRAAATASGATLHRTLYGHMQLICEAREAAMSIDSGSRAPKSKVARLV